MNVLLVLTYAYGGSQIKVTFVLKTVLGRISNAFLPKTENIAAPSPPPHGIYSKHVFTVCCTFFAPLEKYLASVRLQISIFLFKQPRLNFYYMIISQCSICYKYKDSGTSLGNCIKCNYLDWKKLKSDLIQAVNIREIQRHSEFLIALFCSISRGTKQIAV